jgi:hypothetical protein
MMSRPCAAVLAALATTAIGCTACTAASTSGPSPARHNAETSRRPARTASCPAVTLPVSQAGLRAAAALAARFAAAYLTRPPGQSPGQWLARLAPLITGQLYAVLARTAATPALWPPGQPAAAATIAAVQVRDLAAGSVVLTVTAWVRQAGTTASAATTVVTLAVTLAVTVVTDAAGWAVYDVEPAAAGNAG